MTAGPLLFWLFATMVVGGGLMAVLLPRIVHAVFSLMLCFSGVAAVELSKASRTRKLPKTVAPSGTSAQQ